MTTSIAQTRPYAAATSMLAAMALIGLIDNLIALIAVKTGLWQFLFLRACLSVPLIIGTGLIVGARLLPVNWTPVVLRSLCVTIAMLFYFGALAFMPIAQALAGLFTSPVFVLLISAIWLKQPIGLWRITAVIMGFAGVLIVLGLNTETLSPLAFLPILGGFFYALGAVITRTHCAEESTLSMLAGVMLAQWSVGAIVLIVLSGFTLDVPAGSDGFLLRGWVWPVTGAVLWIVIQAVGSSIGVGLIIRAYQLGDASYVAVYEYSVFIAGPFFAWWLFGQSLALNQLAGIALIAAAGILITVRSR